MRFNIKVEAQALISEARRLSATMREVQRPTREIALRLISRGRERLQARPPGKFQPQVRTGLLARSLYARPTTATEVVVASQFPYSRIQQQGGVVLPVTGKCLAIPLTAELKRAGTWPRDWPRGSLTFIPINKGKTVGMLVGSASQEPGRKGKREKKGKTQKRVSTSEPLYLLVKSSLIPTRPYIVWDAEMKQTTKDAWARHLKGTPVA